MSVEVVVALITAASALLLSIFNYFVASASRRRDAQLDYEYEARKRLYAEFQPLLFQLVELCERAYFRIFGLAEAAREGHLRGDRADWLKADYYRLSTYYRLLAPLVLFRLCQRRLTLVDPRLHAQYAMAKSLYISWSQGFQLAKKAPQLPYTIYESRNVSTPTDARKDVMQHIVFGQLDQVIDALTYRESDGELRCLSYGEFENEYMNETSHVTAAIKRIDYLFNGFHPQRRPILWRIFIAQAHIHKALIRTFDLGDKNTVLPVDAITEQERNNFDWREEESEASRAEAIDEPFAAALEYLRDEQTYAT